MASSRRATLTVALRLSRCHPGLQKPLDVMEAHLAISSYLASDAFSLADLGYLPYLQAACSHCSHIRPDLVHFVFTVATASISHLVACQRCP